jgi:hypothetical protein
MVTLELEGVVQRALSVYPEERYPSVLAFASALLAASTTRPVPVAETTSQQEATHHPEPAQLLADNASLVTEPELPPQNGITHVNEVEVLPSPETEPSFDFEPPTHPEPNEPQIPQEPETHPQPTPDVPQPDEPDTHPQQPEPETPQPATLPEPTPQKVPDVPQPLPEPEVPEPNPEPSPEPAPQREIPQPTPDPIPQPAPDIPQPLPQPEIPQIEPQTPPQIEPYAGETLSFSQASRGGSSNACDVEPNISPRFVIISPYEGEPYEVLLGQKETTIGRAGSSDILLDRDNLTSRHHALLKYEDNHYVIYDRGSANGVFVNGQRLIGNTGYMLLDGDHISVGNYELIFRFRIPKNVGENVEVFSASSA